jgi:asparagine synthase (glutamine-hydrolysing)
MARAVAHRGPDDEGFWQDESLGVGFAHRRLSVIDLSAAGHQPMLSASGRFVIVLNGEIYNHLELRAALEKEGAAPVWRGHSDTETLIEGVAHWGVRKALSRLVGMFAFAVWDRETRTLTLARDRLGEKPLYYGFLGREFAFASELKSLCAHRHFDKSIDRGALALLLRFSYIPAPQTIYQEVRKLPPASFLTIGAESMKPAVDTYWNARMLAAPAAVGSRELADGDAIDGLEALLKQAVKGQLIADVPLGAFLSGGVDSSTVVALMQAVSARPVKTFSIGFSEVGYDEAQHAKLVARHLGTEHTELYVAPADALAVISKLPAIYDEPFADASQIPTHLVSQLARKEVTVALSGDAGDELFGGYSRYLFMERGWRSLQRVPVPLRRGAGKILRSVSPDTWDEVLALLFRLAPRRYRLPNPGGLLHKLAGTLDATDADSFYLRLISRLPAPEDVVIGGNEPATLLGDPRLATDFPDPVQRMMFFDLMTYLPDDILAKVDRAAMAVSLETRIPLLDHRVVEFAMRIPMHQKIRAGHTKWLLRQVLYRYVPPDLIERPKQGFSVPIDGWLRGPLRGWADSLLDEARLKREGYFHPVPVRRWWTEHLSGRRNWQDVLWNVLMFQAWLEKNR